MNRLIFILIVLVFFCIESFAQIKLALIIDKKDGYANIYEDTSSQSKIVGQIKNDELTNCFLKYNTNWYQIYTAKWDSIRERWDDLTGYVYKNSIQIIEDAPINEQKKIISKVLKDYIKINDEWNLFHSRYKDNEKHFKSISDSIKQNQLYQADFNYVDKKYDPILGYFSTYYCKTKDIEILNQLFLTIWANRSTANESPSFTLGECYICDEKLFLNQLRNIRNHEQLDLLINDIDWGLANHFYTKEEPDYKINKEYLRLSKNLEDLKK